MTRFRRKSAALNLVRIIPVWHAWVGTFDDLLSYANDDPSDDSKGEYLIELGRTYCPGKPYDVAHDNGYSGMACVNGVFNVVGYGCFDNTGADRYIIPAHSPSLELTPRGYFTHTHFIQTKRTDKHRITQYRRLPSLSAPSFMRIHERINSSPTFASQTLRTPPPFKKILSISFIRLCKSEFCANIA